MRSTSRSVHTREVQENLRAGTFYHGCKNLEDLGSISTQGFRGDFFDEEGRWQRDGNLGKGVYLTCDWRTAVWFGSILLEATLLQGTRILDTSIPPDRRVLRYLKREFGNELLVTGDIRKILPKNKQLSLPELVELTRYFYDRVWNRDWSTEKSWRFSACDRREMRALHHAVSFLKRYGFHGYGHPQDDNGIVIFAPDRIKLTKVVRILSWQEHHQSIEDESLRGISLADYLANSRRRSC